MRMNPVSRLHGSRPARLLAIASTALITTPAFIAATFVPASAETVDCASSFNQQGSRCASFTFSTRFGVLAVTTAPSQAAGSSVGVASYEFGSAPPAPDQDLDTLQVNAQGVPDNNGAYTELEIMPNGVEGTLCLKATSNKAGATFVLAQCGSSQLEQFDGSKESSQGFEWHLRGSGSPGLAISEEVAFGIQLEPWTGAFNQWMQRTD